MAFIFFGFQNIQYIVLVACVSGLSILYCPFGFFLTFIKKIARYAIFRWRPKKDISSNLE
jgi:hypothetical protein